MSVITIRRTHRKRSAERRYLLLRSFREMSRRYFARESMFEFILEVLLFLGIAGVSLWPMLMAANALQDLLQRFAN